MCCLILLVKDTFGDELEGSEEDDGIVGVDGDPPPPAALEEFDKGVVLVDKCCSR